MFLAKELRRFKRTVWVEGTIPVPVAEGCLYDCICRVWVGDNLGATLKATGNSPTRAYFNAALFAVRQTILGDRMVPVLGRLYTRGPITVDLMVADGHQNAPRYELVMRHRPMERWTPPVLTRNGRPLNESYEMEVVLADDDGYRGTRYLLVNGVHPDLKWLIKPYMKTQVVSLHRLLLALDRNYMNFNQEETLVHARRSLLGDAYRDLGDTLEGHHHNGLGWDNRRCNLKPLTEDHGRLHLPLGLDDLKDPGWFRGANGLLRVLRPPPVILIPRDHEPENIWSYLDPDSIESPFWWGATWARPQVDPPPATVQDLLVVGRSDFADRVRDMLRAIVILGGQARKSQLKCVTSMKRLSSKTLDNLISALEGIGIVEVRRGGRGEASHCRIVRLMQPDLYKATLDRRCWRRVSRAADQEQ